MPAPRPIAVGPRKAAAMLDMPQKDFLRLVERGALPRPVRIGPYERWSWDHLKCIALGIAQDNVEGIPWKDFLEDKRPSAFSSRYIPLAVRKEVRARDGEKCAYCGCTSGPFELDHIEPFSIGGDHTADNLCVACKRCNSSKRARFLHEWSGASASSPDDT